MGYRPRIRSPRASGRGTGTLRHEKAKARRRNHGSVSSSIGEEKHVATMEEVADRALNLLRNMGSQRFALYPYSEHLDGWLVNLKGVLSEFESTISVDEQFVKDRSQILLNIEVVLEKRSRMEASLQETIKSLSDSKNRLEQLEEEYATRAREIEGRKNSEIKRLNSKIDSFRGERDGIAQMKTGLFGAISKKAKAQKETETTQRLNTVQRELASAVHDFIAEQERLRDEYERKKQSVIDQVSENQKETVNLETDGSLEDRRVACEALVNAVNALLQRKMLQFH